MERRKLSLWVNNHQPGNLIMLPIKKIVLFKHGVSHVEREGQIEGNTSIDLYFRAAEMNDVLKSLTVLDLDDGVITSISYESTLPIEEQLKDIAIQLPQKNVLTGLLSQLQGAHVALEIEQQTVTGIIIGIETIKRQTELAAFDTTYLSLLVKGEMLQSFDMMEIQHITLLDDNLQKDLQHLLEVLIATKKKDLKKLTIFVKGEGTRTINLSYIVATPVWKTSYRLLLEEQQTLIQGWALVDNTQDEDWENVCLSLVAGLPVSFTHDLYSPRYQKRPEVRIEEETAYAPLIAERTGDRLSLIEAASFDEDILFEEGEERPQAAKPVSAANVSQKQQKKAARERSVPVQTQTVEVGDLFHYEIENPVTVRRQQSALVPILQTEFSGKPIVVYHREVRQQNPMTAILFKNTTGLTLDNGPVTVFEEDAYVGEAMLNTLKPDEEQILAYSVELECVVSIDSQRERDKNHQIQITDGDIELYYYEFFYEIYNIHNKSERHLDFILEHRFRPDCELVETPKPIERTDHFYRFRFPVQNKKTKSFTVIECIERSSSFDLKTIIQHNPKWWLDKKYIDKIDKKIRRVLEGVIQLTEKLSQIEGDLKIKEAALKAIFKNQERIRQNLQSLGKTEDERGLRERYVANLEQEENKLVQYQADIERWQAEKKTTEQLLNTQVQNIEFKATL
jgi:hypothetical protein